MPPTQITLIACTLVTPGGAGVADHSPASMVVRWMRQSTVVALLMTSVGLSAQPLTKLPEPIMSLAKRYDESRKKALQPILDSFVVDLKGKVIPGLTRSGKADIAVKLAQASEALKNLDTPVLPWIDAPFPKEAFAPLQATQEWQVFTDRFAKSEASLNNSYMKALERERQLFQTKGDPGGVVAVNSEIKRIGALKVGVVGGKEGSSSPPPTVAGAISQPNARGRLSSSEKRRIESYFIAKTWATVPLTAGLPELLFFAKDGTVAFKNGHDGSVFLKATWRMEDDGIVFVQSAGYPRHITFLTAEDASMVKHNPPDKGGDVKLSLKVTAQHIEGVR